MAVPYYGKGANDAVYRTTRTTSDYAAKQPTTARMVVSTWKERNEEDLLIERTTILDKETIDAEGGSVETKDSFTIITQREPSKNTKTTKTERTVL